MFTISINLTIGLLFKSYALFKLVKDIDMAVYDYMTINWLSPQQ